MPTWIVPAKTRPWIRNTPAWPAPPAASACKATPTGSNSAICESRNEKKNPYSYHYHTHHSDDRKRVQTRLVLHNSFTLNELWNYLSACHFGSGDRKKKEKSQAAIQSYVASRIFSYHEQQRHTFP